MPDGDKTMKTHFSFGKDGIDVSVPDGFDCQVLRSHTANALADWAAEIERAIDHPIRLRAAGHAGEGKKDSGDFRV